MGCFSIGSTNFLSLALTLVVLSVQSLSSSGNPCSYTQPLWSIIKVSFLLWKGLNDLPTICKYNPNDLVGLQIITQLTFGQSHPSVKTIQLLNTFILPFLKSDKTASRSISGISPSI